PSTLLPHSPPTRPDHLFLLLTRPPPCSTLFPYTTLFRSPTTRRMAASPSSRTSWAAPRTTCPTRRSCSGCATRSAHRCSDPWPRSEEHTSELQSHLNLVCRLLLEKKKEN